MEKIIKERGEYKLNDGTIESYEVYEDNSATANCVVCGKVEEISSEKYGKFALNNSNWYKSYTCLNCWRANKDSTKREEISFAQSFNLAVQMLRYEPENSERTDIQKKFLIREWQKWFYKELTSDNTINEEKALPF
jgi:hypothetical protein